MQILLVLKNFFELQSLGCRIEEIIQGEEFFQIHFACQLTGFEASIVEVSRVELAKEGSDEITVDNSKASKVTLNATLLSGSVRLAFMVLTLGGSPTVKEGLSPWYLLIIREPP